MDDIFLYRLHSGELVIATKDSDLGILVKPFIVIVVPQEQSEIIAGQQKMGIKVFLRDYEDVYFGMNAEPPIIEEHSIQSKTKPNNDLLNMYQRAIGGIVLAKSSDLPPT